MNKNNISDYPVTLSLRAAWGDMDAFGHVNNTQFFRYFESARIAYFETCCFIGPGNKSHVAPILAREDCKFIRPLYYPDNILAGARVISVSEDRFRMQYCLLSEKHQTTAAIGTGDIVTFDYREKRKEPVPESWLRAISQTEQKSLAELTELAEE